MVSIHKIKWCLLVFILFSLKAFSQDFYDINKIRDIKITFKEKKWDHILDSLMKDGKGKRLEADIVVDGIKYKQVGVRYKGNSSYNSIRKQKKSKLPFNIDANFKLKKQTFQEGILSLKLSNMSMDPSCIREVLGYYMANSIMPSPKANFCRLYVNGKYLGVYTNTESIDERFLKNHFKNNKGVLVKCDPNWAIKEPAACPKGDNASLLYQGEDSTCYLRNYELKSKYGYKELIKLVRILNKEAEKLESLLDIDKTLWMHAYNHTMVNLDSYSGMLSHNYYLYKDTNGIFFPLIWDLNLAFGGFNKDYKKTLTEDQLFNYSIVEHQLDPSRPLIQKLLEKPLYRKLYLAHVRFIYKHLFANEALLKKADEYHKFIDAEVLKDKNNLYTYSEFKQNLESRVGSGNTSVVGLKELIKARTDYMSKSEILADGPQLGDPVAKRDSANISVSVKCTGADKVYLFYRNKKQGHFSYVLMQTVEAESSAQTDKTYTKQLPLIDDTYYYIVAENSKTATVIPEKAPFEALKVQ